MNFDLQTNFLNSPWPCCGLLAPSASQLSGF